MIWGGKKVPLFTETPIYTLSLVKDHMLQPIIGKSSVFMLWDYPLALWVLPYLDLRLWFLGEYPTLDFFPQGSKAPSWKYNDRRKRHVVAGVVFEATKKAPQKTSILLRRQLWGSDFILDVLHRSKKTPRFWRKKHVGMCKSCVMCFYTFVILVFFGHFWCTDWISNCLDVFLSWQNQMMSGVLGNKARGKRTNQGMANCWDIKRPTTLWQTLRLNKAGFGQTHWGSDNLGL